jgi:hypothetical protein
MLVIYISHRSPGAPLAAHHRLRNGMPQHMTWRPSPDEIIADARPPLDTSIPSAADRQPRRLKSAA